MTGRRSDLSEVESAFGRGWVGAQIERPIGPVRLVGRSSIAGVVGADLTPQEFVYLGGPTTAPGYEFHELVGRLGATQRVEARLGIPFPSLPLGRYGTTGASATLAPFAHTAYVARVAGSIRGDREAGWYPSVGIGLMTVFDLLRFDVAKGLRDGRWAFSVDVIRDFWPIL